MQSGLMRAVLYSEWETGSEKLIRSIDIKDYSNKLLDRGSLVKKVKQDNSGVSVGSNTVFWQTSGNVISCPLTVNRTICSRGCYLFMTLLLHLQEISAKLNVNGLESGVCRKVQGKK